jgi:hypothetical protein
MGFATLASPQHTIQVQQSEGRTPVLYVRVDGGRRVAAAWSAPDQRTDGQRERDLWAKMLLATKRKLGKVMSFLIEHFLAG